MDLIVDNHYRERTTNNIIKITKIQDDKVYGVEVGEYVYNNGQAYYRIFSYSPYTFVNFIKDFKLIYADAIYKPKIKTTIWYEELSKCNKISLRSKKKEFSTLQLNSYIKNQKKPIVMYIYSPNGDIKNIIGRNLLNSPELSFKFTLNSRKLNQILA